MALMKTRESENIHCAGEYSFADEFTIRGNQAQPRLHQLAAECSCVRVQAPAFLVATSN